VSALELQHRQALSDDAKRDAKEARLMRAEMMVNMMKEAHHLSGQTIMFDAICKCLKGVDISTFANKVNAQFVANVTFGTNGRRLPELLRQAQLDNYRMEWVTPEEHAGKQQVCYCCNTLKQPFAVFRPEVVAADDRTTRYVGSHCLLKWGIMRKALQLRHLVIAVSGSVTSERECIKIAENVEKQFEQLAAMTAGRYPELDETLGEFVPDGEWSSVTFVNILPLFAPLDDGANSAAKRRLLSCINWFYKDYPADWFLPESVSDGT
jgi:hypothetical protein